MKIISVFENETITPEMVKRICENLQRNRIEMLSFRKCSITDKDYKKVMKAIGGCTSLSLRHLCLNINIVSDSFRAQILAHAIQRNASLIGLHLHGNRISDSDFEAMYLNLKTHPRVVSLDLGDCGLGDAAMDLICHLIKERHGISGLHNLILSHNPRITSNGWTKFGMALASGANLKSLEIDFNNLGDTVASCLVTALPGAACLETLDMECTGITDKTGEVLLHLVQTYSLKLKSINLEKTDVLDATKEAIKFHLTKVQDIKADEPLSEDQCSLAMSEPPLSEEDGDGVRTTADGDGLGRTDNCDSLDDEARTNKIETNGVPIVEVSPANKPEQEMSQLCMLQELRIKEGSKSMSTIDAGKVNLNAAGFEIKKAFSLNDFTDVSDDNQTKLGAEDVYANGLEEHETNISSKGSQKHRDSVTTLVEQMATLENHKEDHSPSPSASMFSVKSIVETADTSQSRNCSPLVYTRPMSAPMSRHDKLNVENGLFQAKSTDTSAGSVASDLASLIQQRKEKMTRETIIQENQINTDIEVQDIS